MTDATFLIGFVAVIAIVLAAVFFRKRRQHMARSASTCGSDPKPGGTMQALAWFIGPRLTEGQGGNKSPGMPEHPTQEGGSWFFDLPVGENLPLGTGPKVDYVTFNHGPLSGKREIRMKYRLELSPGAALLAVPEQIPEAMFPAMITLFFQREGDDWTAKGKYDAYRWYHPAGYLHEGEYEITVPLDSGWNSVGAALVSSVKFQEAKNNACCVGFVFGGNEIGYGHGMRATGPGRFVLTQFEVL